MANVKRFDERMTVNIESDKKKLLQKLAEEDKLSDSMFLLKIIDKWLEKRAFDDEYSRENNGSSTYT